ncbi:MAG: hypothetical protein ACK4NS_05385 [Saprospiraceae bacterium]
MFNRLLPFFLVLCCARLAQAQISAGGSPLALSGGANADAALAARPPAWVYPAPDLKVWLAEDAKQSGPLRFAAPITTDISPALQGAWSDLPDGGRVWQFRGAMEGALGVVLLFDRFRMPKGGRFFAYTPDGRVVRGAYTEQSNSESGKFTIGPLPGEEFVLEYRLAADAADEGEIWLNRIDYAYRRFEDTESALSTGFGASLSCHINVNCPEGADLQTEKRGIARMLMVFSNGTGFCTGSLIANTSETPEPYLLSAHHCQLIGLNPMFDQWAFHFDYEAPGCANPAAEPAFKSVLGCQRIAFRDETDFMLLRLNPIPPSYGVYFNGWTRSAAPPATTSFIHHPAGDIKKVSRDAKAPVIHPNTINWGPGFGISPVNTHWRTQPETGTYQPGSSGCPLFTPSRLIFGQLHGGSYVQGNECVVNAAFFGRFDLSWDQGAAPGARLREWLDPANTNKMSQQGYQQPPPPAVHAISGVVRTWKGDPMSDVPVRLSGSATQNTHTNGDGYFQFSNLPAGGDYQIAPELTENPLNGLSTFDIVLIQKHILGQELFDSPWKIIAGDTNSGNTLTPFDIVLIRRLILGIDDAFPGTPSWRFFPKTLTFSNPDNPFADAPFPSDISISNLSADMNAIDFIGVKIGDVNGSAQY